jgi:hypothetical protein
VPGSAAANVAFLSGRVRGVMLCCLESSPRLPSPCPDPDAFGPQLDWHLHLPVDLPWEQGPQAAAAVALRVAAATDRLPRAAGSRPSAVLHLPPDIRLLPEFERIWNSCASMRLLLENTPEAFFPEFSAAPPGQAPAGLCLDVAHLVLFCARHRLRPARLCPPERLAALEMLHWSAPCNGRDAHAPLTQLDGEGKTLYRSLAQQTDGKLDVLEIFDWQGLAASWAVLRGWRKGQGDSASAHKEPAP